MIDYLNQTSDEVSVDAKGGTFLRCWKVWSSSEARCPEVARRKAQFVGIITLMRAWTCGLPAEDSSSLATFCMSTLLSPSAVMPACANLWARSQPVVI